MTFWEALFAWLKESVPGWLASFGIGYKVGASGKKAVENEKARLELENEKLKNREAVRDADAGKYSVDIVGEIPGVGPPASVDDGDPGNGG